MAVAKVCSYSQADVERGIEELVCELGGLAVFISGGDKVLLKPNMVEGLPPEKAVTTHPEVLRAVIREVRKIGAVPFVGDSPGIGYCAKVAEKCGILQVCRDEGVELLSFQDTVEVAYPQGQLVKRFCIAKELTEVDKVISLAKMKTHTFMGITGGVKNLFGFIVGPQKAQFHFRMKKRADFAAMLVDLDRLVKPALYIIDGIMGMEGDGPRNGSPRSAGVLLAGDNGFAVDMVMSEIMGFRAERVPVTSLALTRGLVSCSGIEITGSGKDVRHSFREPRTLETLEDRLPEWLVRFGRGQLTALPQIKDGCIVCGRCIRHCPPQAMSIVNTRVKIDFDRCIRCYCCQELCPENAVGLREGFLLKFARWMGW